MKLDAAVPDRWIWVDGRLSRATEAALPVLDPDARDVEALFETLRVSHRVPLLWRNHLDRLARSAAELGFPVPPASDMLEEAMARVLEASLLDDAVVRITVMKGRPGGPPVRPRWWLEAEPLEARLWTGTRRGQATAIFASQPFDPGSLARHKTTSRRAHNVARDEARARGADEALLVSPRGLVLEGTVSNVFAVAGGEIITPPLSGGILPGIVRGLVLEACRDQGYAAHEEGFHRERLVSADEVFLTNAVQGVVPIGILEGRPLPSRAIGLQVMQICRTTAERGA